MYICKNDYYKLTPWFIRACVSISRGSTKKYKSVKTEEKQGYYLTIFEGPITLKVPFRALFDTNKKIAPSHGLSFISALDCPSDKKGLCQLSESDKTCYAKQGAKQASGKYITSGAYKGVPCLNSYYNSCLVTTCLDKIQQDKKIFLKLCGYINQYIKVLRFNLKGDFRTLKDYKFILKLSNNCPRTVFYGYTARDDILTPELDSPNNFYLNGSNKKYTNRFKACYSLQDWLKTSIICLGSCKDCKKCYSLKNKNILCLIHGPSQDQELNTWLNRTFLCDLFNSLNTVDSPVLKPSDLKVKKGLLESLNHQLSNKLNIDLVFKDYWNFRKWVHGLHYTIKDTKELMRDYNKLQALEVA